MRRAVDAGLLSGPDRLVGQFLELLLVVEAEAALAELDLDLLERTRELERHLLQVVLDDGRASVLADIERFVEREASRNGLLDLALRDLLAVHGERAGAALAVAGAIVLEVELDGVLPGGEL